jgi:hypothetical protein
VPRYLYLTPVLGGPGAPRYPVSDKLQLVGRSEKASISLLEPTVSRRHASIQVKDGAVRLVDLGSKHGTYVNSRRVSTAKLRVGDIVVFGLSLVLRLEESREPIPLTEPPPFPAEAPTLIDPLETLVSTIGETKGPGRRLPTGPEMAPPDHEVSSEVEALCSSMLPEAHARLAELRNSLRRQVEDGVVETDPYPILASVESVLATVNRLVEAIGGETGQDPTRCRLDQLLLRAVDRVAPDFVARRVSFMTEVAPTYHTWADPAVLERLLLLLLRSAGRKCRDNSPVEVVATGDDETVTVAVSHLGAPYPLDALEREDPGDPSLRELGEARQLAHGIAGLLAVESKPKVGSTVRLTLRATP